ncbi:defensin coprisin [Macrosteles quadrilineatus]|uniref:defensin coprisin n=1 Tax=Macrosteles quadrilineatus TaxID=74068 RepID=UPI0023E0BC2C|nr:defensin coprisin [Macrosteles quadrilineatus]
MEGGRIYNQLTIDQLSVTCNQLFNMSPSLSVCLCLLLATTVLAVPTYNYYSEDDMAGVRLPRATCDLLSFSFNGNSLNHAACAAHCITLNRGFRGGRCRDGVCHCRK